MLILVSYDIVSDQRRDRVHNALKDFGVRVQFSVFECHLDERELEQLEKRLGSLIDATCDGVRYYSVCAACEKRVVTQGLNDYRGERGAIIL